MEFRFVLGGLTVSADQLGTLAIFTSRKMLVDLSIAVDDASLNARVGITKGYLRCHDSCERAGGFWQTRC